MTGKLFGIPLVIIFLVFLIGLITTLPSILMFRALNKHLNSQDGYLQSIQNSTLILNTLASPVPSPVIEPSPLEIPSPTAKVKTATPSSTTP